MSHRGIRVWGAMCIMALALAWGLHVDQRGQRSQATGAAPQHGPRTPIKITPEELHRLGGVPPGWHFRFPDGDPGAGRVVFAKLECYQCHTIQGESFPQESTSTGSIGPELTGMGDRHPVEYFAESILDPNAVIVLGPGYTDADGRSIMPDFRDSMSVAEFTDLLAYLQSLKGGDGHGVAHDAKGHRDGHDDHGALLDQVLGDYRIRLMYHEGKASGHGAGTARGKAQNHLMAFITAGKTGEPVPYLPVSATIATAKQAPRKVKLTPMIGDHGFHYGADVSLPPRPAKVTLSIGPTTMRVMPSATGRFAKPQQVSFDWQPQPPATTAAREYAPPPPDQGKHSDVKGH